ncbi:MAG TPA: MarR family transcriptional regulator [Phaeodactylibacter sp.]|nr:MarR family transcriptional regulator [Phaeodactylibacter sp.]
MFSYLCAMALKKSYDLLESTDPWICVASKLALSIRTVSAIYRKHLKAHNVTMSQLSLLMIVGKHKFLPQSEIGRKLMLERSTVTRDLKRMIERGYFVKKYDKSRPVIYITDKGASYVESIIPDWKAATEEAKAKLGEDGEQALNLVLHKLTK